jgi:hypothetical protein
MKSDYDLWLFEGFLKYVYFFSNILLNDSFYSICQPKKLHGNMFTSAFTYTFSLKVKIFSAP